MTQPEEFYGFINFPLEQSQPHKNKKSTCSNEFMLNSAVMI